MANFTTNLTITTPKETFTTTSSGSLEEIHRVSQEVSAATDTGTYIMVNAGSIGQQTFRSSKGMIIKNSGLVGAEIMIVHNSWSDGGGSATASPTTSTAVDTDQANAVISFLLGAGDAIYFPSSRFTDPGSLNSMANAKLLDNQAPDSNMYLDSGYDSTDETHAVANITGSATDTGFFPSGSGTWNVGDILRVNNEIIEIAEKNADHYIVIRGAYGSTAASDHADNDDIRLPFFNAYSNFTAATGGYDTVQTDGSGRFKATNFFGYGRTTPNGIVPGSISGKFYSQGYQELGLSGVTSSTESGLTASETLKLDITVDGGTLFQDLTFTLSSNTKFGGSDGVIRKIQDALDVQYYTAGNLFEKRVTVGIVNGDIRFTSGSRLSTSAILLGDTGDSDTFIDAAANGRIPAAAKIGKPVAGVLPNDTITDKKTNLATKNVGLMFYDNGHGIISGACSGTINYATGHIDLNRCPANAHFVVSASYGSGHSGGDSTANALVSIGARSVNHKINTTIDIIAVR